MIRLARTVVMRAKDCNSLHNICRFSISGPNLPEPGIQSKEGEVLDNGPMKAQNDNETLYSKLHIEETHDKINFKVSNLNSVQDFTKLLELENNVTFMNQISPIKAIEIIKFITSMKSRPVKLIDKLCSKINRSSQPLTLKQCSDLLYYLAVLSIKNVVLLNRIVNDIINSKEKLNSGVLPASILHSCGKLRYRNCELIDFLVPIILEPQNPKRNSEMLKALLTMAVVNYVSPYGVVIMNELIKCSIKNFNGTKSYLDFVWASIILNNFSEEHISTVLSEDFVNKLKALEGSSGYSEGTKLKLLNINGAAAHLYSYNGSKLNDSEYKTCSYNTNTEFLSSVIDGLNHLFPKHGYLGLNVDTKAGFSIDIECYIDSNGNPVSLKKKKDGIKIGFLLVNHKDICLGEGNHESGLLAFKQRILEAKGYKVAKVLFNEYYPALELYKKVNYLQKKLNAFVESEK